MRFEEPRLTTSSATFKVFEDMNIATSTTARKPFGAILSV
jgi:hypothetical protein